MAFSKSIYIKHIKNFKIIPSYQKNKKKLKTKQKTEYKIVQNNKSFCNSISVLQFKRK